MKTQAHISALFWFVTILWSGGSYGAAVVREPHEIGVAISDQVVESSVASSRRVLTRADNLPLIHLVADMAKGEVSGPKCAAN